MSFADSERSMARRHLGGQDRSSLKGVSCGVGEEDCHVVSVMRDHVGTYGRPKEGWMEIASCPRGEVVLKGEVGGMPGNFPKEMHVH